jgi:hypothetical protein
MRPFNAARIVLALSATLTVSACVATVRPRAGVVYVQQGPPPRVVEVIGVPPSRAHVWIEGHHEWRGRDYVWVPGRFEVIPQGFRRYEPGRWNHERAGWYWQEGRWR